MPMKNKQYGIETKQQEQQQHQTANSNNLGRSATQNVSKQKCSEVCSDKAKREIMSTKHNLATVETIFTVLKFGRLRIILY